MRAIRSELSARLRQRFGEIEAQMLARIRALSDPFGDDDAEYSVGQREAVTTGLEYALTAVEEGGDWQGPIPQATAVQARRAARAGVRLDTVLRRYATGDRLLGEFIMDEADRFPSQALRMVLSSQGPQVDRLMASVAAEYMDEIEQMRRSPKQRLADRTQRLLAGDSSVDSVTLGYELDAWHIGVIATGPKAEETVKEVASALDRQLMSVPRGTGLVWAWLGGQQRLELEEIERFLADDPSPDYSLAVGEPRPGVDGWRLTHREAQAALEVMLRKPQRLRRGSDAILTAALLRDGVLAQSLLETYVAPLGADDASAASIRETLRAYFEVGLNAATAAAALGVDRHTVQRRLRKAEAALGRRLDTCHAELEVALRLDELQSPKRDDLRPMRPMD